jgi:hypothetical protein
MAKWLLSLSMLAAQPAYAGGSVDVKDCLSRPVVKILAVEFCATLLPPQTPEPVGRSEMRPHLPAFYVVEGAPC